MSGRGKNLSIVEKAPERISGDDLEILASFWQQIEAAQREQEIAQRGLAIVGRTLSPRYHLGPNDLVERDGTISRGKLIAQPDTPHVADAPPMAADDAAVDAPAEDMTPAEETGD